MKKLLSLLLVLSLLAALLVGCVKDPGTTPGTGGPGSGTPDQSTQTPGTTPTVTTWAINGVPLKDYAVVYAASAPDYTARAAQYIANEIKARTGLELPLHSDAEQATPLAHEIVVGESTRAISTALNANTQGVSFAVLADDAHVALEGEYFVIAAAAYYFVETYIGAAPMWASVAKEARVYQPITKENKNCIYLIGDGMGLNHTKLFETLSAASLSAYSDGEDVFYGSMLPNFGYISTNSLSGITDSAAAATALASGYKTLNGYVGKDKDGNDTRTLTEIAIALGKSTAVLSTDVITGATPAAFTAHTASRDDTAGILAAQQTLASTHGTILLGGYGEDYSENAIKNRVERDFLDTLAELSKNEKGFFLMYEEAHFDKHSHENDLEDTFRAALRFNQIIACAMEYAFYNPDTVVIITADHETGGLTRSEDESTFLYTTTQHTNSYVPFYAFGAMMEVLHGLSLDNVQIPKTIAGMWNVTITGNDNGSYPPLLP